MRGDLGTVVIADDDADIRTLVSDLLARAGIQSIEAATSDEALTAVREARPALLLVDVGLPGVSGYEVCRDVKEAHGEGLAVILMSETRTEPHDRAAGLLIGADDYMTKPFDSAELLARMRRCIVRSALIEESANGPARWNSFGLSPRELEVLTLLGEGLGTAAIAAQLVISSKTVATHVQRILTKLGAHSRAEAIVIAYRARLIEPVEAQAGIDVA